MQSFTDIAGSVKVSESRALFMNNDRTIMSDNSGTTFPTSDLELGMSCYRTDQKKLYKLVDVANNTWKLIFDLNKTTTTQEYVDQEVAKRSLSTHNHDTRYYERTVSDGRYYTKTHIDGNFLNVDAQASDSGKLGGVNASSFCRLDAAMIRAANLTFNDNKILRLGTSGDFQMWHDGSNTVFKNSLHGAGIQWSTERTDGVSVSALNIEGGITPYVRLFYNGNEHLKTDASGVTVTGQMRATGRLVSDSDQRLKSDIETVSGALDLIKKSRGVQFTMKSNGQKNYGVVAQEIEKQFPYAVVTRPSDVKGEEDIKGVAYPSLVGPLIEAIKELDAKVTKLELAHV